MHADATEPGGGSAGWPTVEDEAWKLAELLRPDAAWKLVGGRPILGLEQPGIKDELRIPEKDQES